MATVDELHALRIELAHMRMKYYEQLGINAQHDLMQHVEAARTASDAAATDLYNVEQRMFVPPS